MGNRKISAGLKECALNLWNTGWDIEDICDTLGVSRASIYRWEAIFAEYGTVNRPASPIRGQQLRILTRALMTACEALFAEESDLYLDEVVAWLALTYDISISVSTLCRNLKEAGLTWKLLHKLAAERDKERRHEWKESMQTNFTGDGSEFVFVDEVSKNEITWARQYGRAMAGRHAALTDVFVHGDRYSLVAAITMEGYMAAHVVEGSFDSENFYTFIATKVVRAISHLSTTSHSFHVASCS
jgi:transposase